METAQNPIPTTMVDEHQESDQQSDRTVSATVGPTEDWAVGTMKMSDVDGHKVAVVRTDDGFHAIDNACPHQGYGLTTGALDGNLVTCQWHNWKFDVTTGRCIKGEEDVACHATEVVEGEVVVSVTRPTDAEEQARLWPSLRRGIESDYVGQVARDSLRLLRTGADAADVMWAGVELGAPKTDYGIGHELAMAADCLAMAEIRHGDEQALPLVQGLSGLSEETRDRPVRAVPAPDPSIVFPDAVEGEDEVGAMASVMAAIDAGDDPAAVRSRFIRTASAHHLAYGHGMIYTQKSFEMLDRVGWDRAPALLPHLAARIVNSTREDTLPYMRKAMRAVTATDLEALASTERQDGWTPDELADTLLAATDAPIDTAVLAAHQGAGIEGLLDAVSLASSRRLLRHDLLVELNLDEEFGWLDITHALTTAQAARWAWRADPGPDTARAALFATWLLFDSGRAERRHGVVDGPTIPDEGPSVDDLGAAIKLGRTESAVALAAGPDRSRIGETLAEASLADRAGSFIVMAHLIKTTEAARREAEELDSSIPLAAAARFLAAPRLERFVARNVAESVEFIRTGHPPKR